MGRFRVLALRAESYIELSASEVLPEVDLERLAHFVQQPDQPRALRAFRDELRGAAR